MSEVKKIKTREEILESYKWNVEKIYKSIKEWENDFDSLKSMVPELSKFQGKMGEAKELLHYLKLNEEISRLFEKLAVFAHLRADEDTTNTAFQILKDKIFTYLAKLKSTQAFFIPEILLLPEGTISREIQQISELRLYEFMLNDILKMKPHTLSKEQEEMLAAVSDCLEAPSNIFNMLSNADITFPAIKDEEGNDIELTEGNYGKFISSKDRKVREEAFKTLFNTYDKYKNTLATSLTSSIKNFVFKSKSRKYGSSLESSLKPNNIPLEVYYNTINTINDHLDSLHRYVRIKKKLLNLNDIHMYDLYVPIIDTPREHIEFKEAIEVAKEGIKLLGKEYLDIFNKGIREGWIDIFENKGKRKGAYSSGSYDTMPYILLNYNYEFRDVSTLVHEMGHSIHSFFSQKSQPYIYSDYTLFCAEVASTTNENLLIRYLIDTEKDNTKRLYLINQELEQIRTTVFRQVMFAEFEKITHESIENGNPLSCDDLKKIWHELNIRYFGTDMIVDNEIDMEWARIPHFYSDFYVYQYATGYAAANSFTKVIIEEGESAVERYKSFLRSGGSDYPINILRNAGVDMLTPKPLENTIERFNTLLDMLEGESKGQI
jgi:oligoendopeptidase F